MARRRTPYVPFVAAALFGGVLVGLELLVRRIGDQTGSQLPTTVMRDIFEPILPWDLVDWAALLPPVVIVFVAAFLFDAVSGNRR